MNFEIRRLEENLVAVLNSSNVAVEVKRLILENLAHKVDVESTKVIASEIAKIKIKEEPEDGSKVN